MYVVCEFQKIKGKYFSGNLSTLMMKEKVQLMFHALTYLRFFLFRNLNHSY